MEMPSETTDVKKVSESNSFASIDLSSNFVSICDVLLHKENNIAPAGMKIAEVGFLNAQRNWQIYCDSSRVGKLLSSYLANIAFHRGDFFELSIVGLSHDYERTVTRLCYVVT